MLASPKWAQSFENFLADGAQTCTNLKKKFWKSFLTYQRLRIFLKGRVSIHLEYTMLLYNIIKGYTVTEFKDLFL